MPNWHIARAQKSDAPALSELVLAAASGHLTTLLGNGDKNRTLDYLRHAFEQPGGQFGFQNHWVIHHQDVTIATCCFWHDQLSPSFDQDTLNSLHAFFGLDESVSILKRNVALNQHIARPTSNQWVTGHISVATTFQRRGCATSLLNFAEQQARVAGKVELVVDVESDNHTAIECYHALGFETDLLAPSGPYRRYVKALN